MDKFLSRIFFLIYKSISSLFPIFSKHYIRKRIAKGKEHKIRWKEKIAIPSVSRPKGKIIWLHAVGLGETLALTGVIESITLKSDNLTFLVTSSTLQSSQAFKKNIPKRTIHQFLPLDNKQYINNFLEYWKPSIVIWAWQDIWPNFIFLLKQKYIPQILINARVTKSSYEKKRRLKPFFSSIYNSFDLISAENSESAKFIEKFGIKKNIRIDGSSKSFSPPLRVDKKELSNLRLITKRRRVFLVASSHKESENIAIEAFEKIYRKDSNVLLIIAPRYPERSKEIQNKISKFSFKVRSLDETPDDSIQIYLADTIGEMGLWYSLAENALIGGSFSKIESHNPWEAINLNCPVIHGPRIANFRDDYLILDRGESAFMVKNSSDLIEVWRTTHWPDIIKNMEIVKSNQIKKMDSLIDEIISFIDRSSKN